uniref:Uncharacterized protein n=1 Tax=Branchiostoma floridae TaxID=7739 RepID=C3ZAS5_BRAFL|eukprot:XP_002593951.1 hypothetical protein BRAFLDRAFT_68615 [Branchiostoma floridae]
MRKKLRHLLIFLLIILKGLNMPEAGCRCWPKWCACRRMGLTSIPQDLPPTIYTLALTVALLTVAITLTIWYKRRVSNSDTASNCIGDMHNTNTTPVANDYENVNTITTDIANENENVGNTNTTAIGHQYEDMNQHNQTGQGQSQANTEPNTNTAATVVNCGNNNQYEDVDKQQNQAGQGQSQTKIKSLDAGNLAYGTGPNASQLNSLYTNTTAVVEASGNGQAGQGQSQAGTESLDIGNLSYGTGLTVSKLNSLYKVEDPCQAITQSNTNTTAAVVTSGHDQTEQGQSQANAESLTIGNLSHNEVLAALQPNTMYEDVKTPQKDPTSTEMTSGHDQTGQGQSQTNAQSLKVGNLTHNEVLAALQPNSMYEDVKTPQKDPTSTEMTSGHDQTGQGQSQINIIQSLNVGNLTHNEVLAALQLNTMYEDVKTPPKDPTSTEMTSGHDQTGQGQSTNTEALKFGNLTHNEVLAALQPNSMYVGAENTTKDRTSAEMTSGPDQTEQLAIAEILRVGNLSHDEVLAALQPNVTCTYNVGVKETPK